MVNNLKLFLELQRRFDAAYEASTRAAALVFHSKYGTSRYYKAMCLFFAFDGRAHALADLQKDLMSGVEPGL